MPDNDKNQNQNQNQNQQGAGANNPAKDPPKDPPKDEARPAAARVKPGTFPVLEIGESSGNLTRDSIIDHTRSKLVEKGVNDAEAQKQACKRGFEMIAD